jgi:hypothetical protein
MKDFYYILGTPRNATPADIEAAYHKLARKFYREGEEQDEFMDTHLQEITEAYDTLRDTRRRNKYDAAVKKNQAKQLAAFKLKYLNIALTVTFLVITILFAGYVVRIINGRTAKKSVQKQQSAQPPVMVITHPPGHHISNAPVVKKTITQTDTSQAPQPQVPLTQAPQQIADSTYAATLHANITGIVYLHQSPDYNSPVLEKIPDAAQIRVLQKGTDYYKIRYNDQTGYVLKSSIAGQ